MVVPRKSATQVTSVTEISVDRDYGVISGERGLRRWVLVSAEGNNIGERQGLLTVGRGRGTQQRAGMGK